MISGVETVRNDRRNKYIERRSGWSWLQLPKNETIHQSSTNSSQLIESHGVTTSWLSVLSLLLADCYALEWRGGHINSAVINLIRLPRVRVFRDDSRRMEPLQLMRYNLKQKVTRWLNEINKPSHKPLVSTGAGINREVRKNDTKGSRNKLPWGCPLLLQARYRTNTISTDLSTYFIRGVEP